MLAAAETVARATAAASCTVVMFAPGANPFTDTDGDNAGLSNRPSPLGDAPRDDRRRPRALVIDDAPDVTEMLAILLQYAGYEVVMVYSGAQGLAAASAGRFDVVVSDIGMPGMNGYELAAAVRALPEYQATPMIAVTGFSMYEDRERALQCGFNAFLTKPINPRDLLNLVERLRS
ncbi:MAG TPA: response regulator [Pyrinomonadaceae bacterium]|nr:response regulator [Pyrinomonadaceae bacterium]